MLVHVEERRSAQRTVRASVSSGGSLIKVDGEIVVRNPAPDASPPANAAGAVHQVKISSALR